MIARRILATLIVTGVAGAIAGTGSYAAFSSASPNTSNQISAGSVAVADSHPAATPLAINGLRPGQTSSTCLNITYTGSLPANLRQYAVSTGALRPHLNVRVSRGTGLTGAFPSCTGFTADAANYAGAGAGILYQGPLANVPASVAATGPDPTSGAPETWTTSESHSFRYDLWLTDTPAAQGLSGDVTLYWEARNL